MKFVAIFDRFFTFSQINLITISKRPESLNVKRKRILKKKIIDKVSKKW